MCYGSIEYEKDEKCICQLYRIPGANVGAFCESLDNILSDIKSKNTMYIYIYIYIYGDFNIEA